MTSLLAISRRRPVRKALVAFLGGMAVVLVGMTIRPVWTQVTRADRAIGDALLRVKGGPPERKDIVLLGIDDASLVGGGEDPQVVADNPILGMMGGRFPWNRSVWAATIDRLADAGAKVIVIDLAFSEPSTPQADQDLADAIARHREKVVLISLFAETGERDVELEVYALNEPLADFFGPGPDDTRCGFANFRPDDDGIVRSAFFSTTLNEMNGKPVHPDETVVYSVAGEILHALGKPVPKERKDLRLSLRYDQRTDSMSAKDVYAPRSFRTIFNPDDWKHIYDEGKFFRDKIVMIGPTAPRFQDTHPTVGGVISGPQLHLQVLTCALEGAFVERHEDDWKFAGASGLIAVALATAWCALVRRPVVSALGAAGIVAGLLAVAFASGAWLACLVPVVMAVVTLGIGWGLAQSYDLVTERLERGRLHREFRRFVSRDVADTLVRDPEAYRSVAGGRRRRVVVLFSDVRGFTSRSEETDPAELVAQLNEYLSRMVDIVFAHGGTLDKFIGDAVMAHWGAIEDGGAGEHARQAVGAAHDMMTGLAELNAKWEGEGRVPFKIGIGLHLGDVLAGEIGSVQRTEFGVIGDPVNLASRIEGMTKYLTVPLLVSGAVVETLDGDNGLRSVGRIRVKGRQEPVELHAPSRGPENDTRFAAALDLFQKGDFASATQAFREVLRLDPDDGAASRFAKWSGDYEVEPPPVWDGTVIMDSK